MGTAILNLIQAFGRTYNKYALEKPLATSIVSIGAISAISDAACQKYVEPWTNNYKKVAQIGNVIIICVASSSKSQNCKARHEHPTKERENTLSPIAA